MLFPARRVMDKNVYFGTPGTTNAQEAKNQDYYRVSKKDQTIREAIRSAYTYARAEEATLEHILQGEDVRYGAKKQVVMHGDPSPSKSKKRNIAASVDTTRYTSPVK